MKFNTFQKVIFITFALLLISVPTATQLTPVLAPIFLSGKSFAARSEPVQNLIRSLFTIVFATGFYLAFLLFRANKTGKQLTDKINKKTIPGFASTLLRHQRSPLLIKAVVILLIILTLHFICVHSKIITFPYQLELREGNTQLTTHAFLNGINPYAIPNNPLYINIYGVLFNLVMLPFAKLMGNTLQLHRLLNGFFILIQAAIIIKVMRTQKSSWLVALLAACFIWLGQLYFSTPLARPDALGGILFLLAIFIPWLHQFDFKSLTLSIVLGVLAYQTKFYFLLSIVIIASYLFLFVSKKRAIIYSIVAGAFFFLNIFILYLNFDTYFVNSLYVSSGSLSMNFEKMFEQLSKFFRDYWGLLVFAFFMLNGFHLDHYKKALSKIKIDFKHINAPALPAKPNFIGFCLTITLLIVVLILNNGTSQVYYYHLVTPFFIILMMSKIDTLKNYKSWLLLLIVLTLFTQSVENLKSDLEPVNLSDWKKIEERISNSKLILNSPLDVSILLDQKKPIAMSGHTQFYFLFPSERFFLFPDPQLMRLEGEKYLQNIAGKIRNKEYEFLETIEKDNYEKFLIGERLDRTQTDQKFIMAYYHAVEILTIPMPHTNEIWKIGIWEPNS